MTTESKKIHKFEEAGLGRAPFRFIGIQDTGAGRNADGLVKTGHINGAECWTKPGGTCDYCGNYIIVFCWVRDADGEKFKVGSDCVEKVGDKGLTNKVKKAVSARRLKQRKERDARRIKEARELLTREDIRGRLTDRPSPNKYRASLGETALQWAEWMLEYAGYTGCISVAKALEKVVEELPSLDERLGN
jgi:hypothetical protein